MKKWTIITLTTLFLLYGFVYHTFTMFAIFVVLFGVGYLLLRGGSTIKDLFKDF